jgi:hypothetical protein
MSYDFRPRNEEAGEFHLGAFSWPFLLEACGYLFPAIHRGGQWYQAPNDDPRFQGEYPETLSNDGFAVTEEEAQIIARIARNFVAIQRTLPEENRGAGLMKQMEINREDLLARMREVLYGSDPQPWPLKIRDDFVEKFAAFADWAEQSGGFEIH